jgi:hypothetical protein
MPKYSEDFSCRDVLAELLNRYVGQGRGLTVEEVAAAARCSVENVYVARRGGAVSHDVAIRLVRGLPDEAGVEYIRRCLGFSHAVRIEETAGGCHHEAGRWAAGFTHEYVDAASDGRITHIEAAKLRRWYFRGMAVLSRLTTGAVQ